MWKLNHLTTRKARLDFSSSGQPQADVTQLWESDIELVNAVECVNWSDSDHQFMICESCGFAGCKSQDWVEIRRTGSIAIITPAFMRLEEAPKSLENEYLPPHYLLERGAIYIEQESYKSMLCLAPFPTFETLSPLSTWAASKIFQLEAPNRVLGHILYPPKLCMDIVIASSEGNFMEQTSELISLINTLLIADRPAILRRRTERDQVISLYLDISGFPEWAALSYDGSRYALYLNPGYIIE
jgi:hypothetical protein